MSSASKGHSYERELRERFLSGGWGCIRMGASGAGGDHDLPDIFAGRDGRLLAIELKSGNATTVYIAGEEITALERFCERWGATPRLGARFTQDDASTVTHLVDPADARMTDGGQYGLPAAEIRERRCAWVTPWGYRTEPIERTAARVVSDDA